MNDLEKVLKKLIKTALEDNGKRIFMKQISCLKKKLKIFFFRLRRRCSIGDDDLWRKILSKKWESK